MCDVCLLQSSLLSSSNDRRQNIGMQETYDPPPIICYVPNRYHFHWLVSSEFTERTHFIRMLKFIFSLLKPRVKMSHQKVTIS